MAASTYPRSRCLNIAVLRTWDIALSKHTHETSKDMERPADWIDGDGGEITGDDDKTDNVEQSQVEKDY